MRRKTTKKNTSINYSSRSVKYKSNNVIFQISCLYELLELLKVFIAIVFIAIAEIAGTQPFLIVLLPSPLCGLRNSKKSKKKKKR